MTRALSLLAAALTAGATLSLADSSSAQSMTIAWDCFDRNTSALVARSAVDLTSPAISCLQAAGAGAQQATAPVDESLATAPDSNPDLIQEPGPDANGFADGGESDPEPTPGTSTGDALGHALGNHLGKLLGQGIADLFGRRR